MKSHDVFKGRVSGNGVVYKVRSVGLAHSDRGIDYFELNINGLDKDAYTLEPASNGVAFYDYIINYENLNNRDLEQVGVGYELTGKNAGLIKVEWDLYGNADIYVDMKEMESNRILRLVS